MKTTTIRISKEKLKLLKAIAGYEGESISKIFEEFAEEYISRHMETMELLKIPDFYEECIEGVKEIKKGGGEKIK